MSGEAVAKAPTVALIGNPNVGKSTIFNRLTGSNQHTGNWPGKTVSAASGQYRFKGNVYTLVDLPGTYSLFSRSAEEEAAVDYLRSGQAACTVAVCDASCLERNLMLVLQLAALTEKLVVCLNLMDEAGKHGIRVDSRRLSSLLGVPVVETSAGTGQGLERLQETVREVCDGFLAPRPVAVEQDTKNVIHTAQRLAGQCVSGRQDNGMTRADRLLTHPVGGRLVMLGLLMVVFWLTIVGANVPSRWLQAGFDLLGGWLSVLAEPWPAFLQGLLLDGVYDTVARVVSVMLPPMAIFFPLFTILEDLGYLPRVAFLLDHSFEKAGACGKQALSMCMGFGCNAAGVVGCRIVDSPRERLIAAVTNGLVPCNGRFPALILLITLFFSQSGPSSSLAAAGMLTGLVALSVWMTMLSSRFLSRTLLRGKPSSFVMELPPFRKPQFRQILVRSVKDRTGFVLLRAVEVAAPAGGLLWLLANVKLGQTSILLGLAQWLEPFGAALGMSGAILLAFVLAAPANELMLPILCMILTAGSTLPQLSDSSIGLLLVQSGWTWQTALCVMIFFLFHWPCTTTLLTVRRETGKWRWALLAAALPTAIGVLLCAGLAALFRLAG